jgi:hypothetical protein
MLPIPKPAPIATKPAPTAAKPVPTETSDKIDKSDITLLFIYY